MGNRWSRRKVRSKQSLHRLSSSRKSLTSLLDCSTSLLGDSTRFRDYWTQFKHYPKHSRDCWLNPKDDSTQFKHYSTQFNHCLTQFEDYWARLKHCSTRFKNNSISLLTNWTSSSTLFCTNLALRINQLTRSQPLKFQSGSALGELGECVLTNDRNYSCNRTSTGAVTTHGKGSKQKGVELHYREAKLEADRRTTLPG